MKSAFILFTLSAFLFLSFGVFSYAVHKDKLTQIDFDTTVRLQDDVPVRLEGFFTLLSDVGSFEPMLILLIIIVLWRRKIISGFVSLSAFVGFHVIELLGKLYIAHPPPPEFFLRTDHGVPFPQFHVRADFSYPSGHSGRAMFITALLGTYLLLHNRIPWYIKVLGVGGLVLYDFLMLVSRVYLGEHWLSDVIGGTLLGVSFGLVGVAINQGLTLLPQKKWSKYL